MCGKLTEITSDINTNRDNRLRPAVILTPTVATDLLGFACTCIHCEYWLPLSAIHGCDDVYLEHCSINIAVATTLPYALRVKHYYGISIDIDIATTP